LTWGNHGQRHCGVSDCTNRHSGDEHGPCSTRDYLIITLRRLSVVNVTTDTTMTTPTNKEQPVVWHPRYRGDKHLVNFKSKDDQILAFDRESLKKERYVTDLSRLMSSEVFGDLFSMEDGSTKEN
jgi:hypothetical protein